MRARILTLWLIVALSLAATVPAGGAVSPIAQTAPPVAADSDVWLQLLTRIPREIELLDVDAGRLYVYTTFSELQIFSLEPGGEVRPRGSSLLGYDSVSYAVRRFDAEGDRAYLLDGVNNLHVYDVSNPDAPRRLSTFAFHSSFIAQGHLLFADGLNFSIYDLSDSQVLKPLASLDVPGFLIHVQAGLAFFHDGSSLHIVSAADPAHPLLAASLALPFDHNAPIHVQAAGDRLYLLGSTSGPALTLLTVDISPLSHPTVIGQSSLQSGDPNRSTFWIDQGTGYVAQQTSNHDFRVYRFSLADPAATVKTLWETSDFILQALQPRGQGLYLNVFDGALLYLDLAAATPAPVRAYETTDDGTSDVLKDDRIPLWPSRDRLAIKLLDVSNPARPRLSPAFQEPLGRVLDLATRDDLAFVLHAPPVSGSQLEETKRLEILDIHDPAAWQALSGVDLYTDTDHVIPGQVKLCGDLALIYILPRLALVDVHDPAHPVLVSVREVTFSDVWFGGYDNLYCTADTLYVLDGKSISWMPLGAPTQPPQVQRLAVEAGAEFDDELPFDPAQPVLFTTFPRLYAIDLSNPARPVVSPLLPGVSLYRADRQGDRLYGVVSGSAPEDRRLVVWDVSNPAKPVQTAAYRLPHFSRSPGQESVAIEVSGDRLLLFDSRLNLYLYRLPSGYFQMFIPIASHP